MTAPLLSSGPHRSRDLYQHLVYLAIASIEMANGDWRALPVDRPPPLSCDG
jgi:hypothetical protein